MVRTSKTASVLFPIVHHLPNGVGAGRRIARGLHPQGHSEQVGFGVMKNRDVKAGAQTFADRLRVGTKSRVAYWNRCKCS
jgi:hypothetical protein